MDGQENACSLHSGLDAQITNLTNKLERSCNEHTRMWEAISKKATSENLTTLDKEVDTKVSLKLFLSLVSLLVVLLVAIIGSNAVLLERGARLEERVKAIQTSVDKHVLRNSIEKKSEG